CANATPGTTIMLDGRPLPTAYGGPNSLTAVVPCELIDRPGEHCVSLQDGSVQSEPLDLSLVRGDYLLRNFPIDGSRLPLVSCIMPTADRHAFIPRAIRQFCRQDYPERELIVLDAGQNPVLDLIPADPRIRYIRAST